MISEDMYAAIKNNLAGLYGSRLRGLILYGSTARGDANEESDIDFLCLLEGPVNPYKEISPIIDAISDIQNSFPERVISVKAVDIDDFERGSYPLVIEAKKDGILV